MKKLITLLLLLSFLKVGAHGHHNHNHDHGGHRDDIYRKILLEKDPSLQRREDSLNQKILQYQNSSRLQRRSTGDLVIPVVIHVVHDGTANSNITDLQIQTGIDHLNQAFKNETAFNPLTGVDVGIQFCLARRDPSGNATSGINRI